VHKTRREKTVLTRRRFLQCCAASGLAAGCLPGLSAVYGRGRGPNIILILADDLGYGDIGCYGQEKIQTPHIDRLAAEGMRFTQAYAGASVCAPSRCSLVTGMHNGHNRVRDNLPPGVFLQPDDVTVAEVLKQAGYKTGCIGKWGLGNPGSWGIPNCQGFDYFYGHLNQDQAHFYYPDYLWENDQVKLLQEMEIVNQVGTITGNRGGKNKFYTNDLFTDKALNFIDEHAKSPFFLFLSYTIPHYSDYPAGTPEHFIVPSDAPYTDKQWQQIEKNYAAMITRMDGDIRKLMDRLKRHGLDSSTLVIFTSDNGPYGGAPVDFFGSARPFRGLKRDLYEGGIRVPFIVRWPGVVKQNTTSNHVLAFWDLLPTFAEITGLPSPKGIDGLSFFPALKGETQRSHEFLFWDYGHVRKTYKAAVRKGHWKGIFETGRPAELYHLEEDPGERDNRAGKHPEILQELRILIDKLRVGTSDYPLRAV